MAGVGSQRDHAQGSIVSMTTPQRTVAILGASANPEKFGNRSLRAHRDRGYLVYPVNGRGGEIEGIPAFRTLAEVPSPLDRISIYLPPSVTAGLLAEIAAKEAAEVYFNPGSYDEQVLNQARELGLNPIAACSIVDGL